jgi:predicted outer membrane repeat protein
MTRRRRRSEEKRRRHGRKVASGAGITVGATLLMGATAQAATFTVNSLADPTDPDHTTLHDAITQANGSHQPSDKITFASGLTGSIDLATDLPSINYSLEIDGPGASQLSVSGGNPGGIFHAVGLANPGLQISGLTLRAGTNGVDGRGGAIFLAGGSPATVSDTVFAGNTAPEGGAIYALNGTLDVRRSTFIGNSAPGGDGGGAISSYGTAVTVSDSVISGNSASQGAGIASTGSGGFGSVLVQNSTVSGNDADGCCGGLLTHVTQTTQIRNSTISGNTVSAGPSGGMYVYGPLTVVGSTIAGNFAAQRGGGIYGSLGYDATIQDSIVARNIAPTGPDIKNVVFAAFSLIGNPAGATVHDPAAGSNLMGVDPQLFPLAQNGGPTPTMALAATSPAIDKGAAFGLGADQRGLGRPFDAPTIPGATAPGADGSDIGAVELQASEVPPAPAAPSAAKKKCKKKKKHKRSAESAKKKHKKCKGKKKKK